MTFAPKNVRPAALHLLLPGRQLRSLMTGGLARDIGANYGGAIVNAAAPLIALPFLLAALGKDNWGIVSFSTLLVAILAVLNAGMAQSLVREFGSRWALGSEGQQRAARLLFGYQRIYWLAGATIALLVLPLAGTITTHWLNLGPIPKRVGTGAIYCAIALFAVQLPGGLYTSVLTALRAQLLQNVVRSTATISRAAGGVAIAYATRSVIDYLLLIAVVTFAETMTLRHFAWQRIDAAAARWDREELVQSLRFSGQMSVLVIMAVLTIQADKFFISIKLPIGQLGIYSIAYSIAMGVLQLSYPVYSAMLPRLIELHHDEAARRRIILSLVLLLPGVLAICALGYVTLGRWILRLWLHDALLAEQVWLALTPLIIGCALNTIYNIGYTNWVSMGRTRWIFGINLTGLVLAVGVTPMAIDRFGYPGAAVSMLGMNMIGAITAIVWLSLYFSRQSPIET